MAFLPENRTPLKNLTAVIIEDEPEHAQRLSGLLSKHPTIDVVDRFETVKLSISKLQRTRIDLVFLDVELSDGSGFEILDAFKEHTPKFKVIFTTGYDKYAVEAIRASAFDFLLKPIVEEELDRCITRVFEQPITDPSADHIAELLFKLQSTPKLRINTRTGFLIINVQDIIFCEADGNYTTIWYKDWKKETSTLHLGLIEKRIDHPDFLRVSRSLLVNSTYISKVDRKQRTCVFEAHNVARALPLSENILRAIGSILQ